jgi:hypothetical protein
MLPFIMFLYMMLPASTVNIAAFFIVCKLDQHFILIVTSILQQVSANERLGYDIFGSPLHGSVGSDVVSSPERIEGLRHVDCCDEDGNTEDDDDNPR